MDSWVAMGTRCGLPIPQNVFSFFPSFLPSFCSLSSLNFHFCCFTAFRASISFSLSLIASHHVIPLSLAPPPLSLSCCCHTRLPISSLSVSLLLQSLCVPLLYTHPAILSCLWSLCLYNIHFYSILFSVVMAIGWGRERASVSKQAGVGVSEVTSLGL